MTDMTGKSIGRYHIIERLGQGGMATVYKGFDTHLEREVAIKLIRTDTIGETFKDAMLKRFERESKALARFSHANIVHVHDYGEFEGTPYLVMEYLTGGTLKARTGTPMPYAEAARLLAPIAQALYYAHQRSIIHRDVKPANILFNENGEPMLTDFGIAKVLEEGAGQTLTGTGVGIGTPEYMSPEQGLGKSVDHRTDIYALGVVFYELITGCKPYSGDTPLAIVVRHIQDPLPRPTSFVAGIPDFVEQVIFKAMAKQPADRYTDMKAFADVLEKLARGGPMGKSPEVTATQTASFPEFTAAAPPAASAEPADWRSSQTPSMVPLPPESLVRNAAPASMLPTAGRPPLVNAVGGANPPPVQPVQPGQPLAKAPRREISVGLIALLGVGVVLLCIVLAGGGFLLYRSLSKTTAIAVAPTSTPSLAAAVNREDTLTPAATATTDPSLVPMQATTAPSLVPPQATPTLVPIVITDTPIAEAMGVVPINTPVLPYGITLQQEMQTYGLIASYPLSQDAADMSKNQSDMTLTLAPFSLGGVYCNGKYSNNSGGGCLIVTPLLNGFDFGSFSIRANFMVNEYQYAPVFVGGQLWRWIGFYLNSDGSLSLQWNNANYSGCSGSYTLNQWHDALVSYDGSVGRMYIDGSLVCEVPYTLENDGDADVGTTNFSNGSTFKGWIRDLKVYKQAIEPYY